MKYEHWQTANPVGLAVWQGSYFVVFTALNDNLVLWRRQRSPRAMTKTAIEMKLLLLVSRPHPGWGSGHQEREFHFAQPPTAQIQSRLRSLAEPPKPRWWMLRRLGGAFVRFER